MLANDFTAVDRTSAWNLTNTPDLKFPTYHPEGLAVVGDRMFLSSTQIIEPTKMYPTPQDGYDRTPGRGIGHLFVIDRQGKLLKDIVLGEGDTYLPGGIDFDGRSTPATVHARFSRGRSGRAGHAWERWCAASTRSRR
ncbi:DUF6454 family protein [Amycolatopsis sp. NPDC051903]|uniref:DUF6454 family protein n=1 Tax=Amycolatopsis sp. NPDC051903 TaxID=3363936 RepID=UPI0037996D1D